MLRIISRPWLSFVLGAWITLLIVFYKWPDKDISILEKQNEMLKLQLKMSHNHMEDLLKNNKAGVSLNHDFSNTVIDENIDACEVIHVAMVCGGYNSTRGIVPLIKSILFYRRNPIHFHLMVDDVAFTILETLFNTWDLPEVTITFYHTNDAIPMVSWIPNAHYSGIFGLLKLTLPNVLPKNLKKVIVLDTDLTFLSDIAELWVLFQKMKNEIFGLVENQSDWYLGKLWHEFKPWPAIGRGFNTGVILLHLDNIRIQINWLLLWKNVTEVNLLKYTGTKLADQDIFNAIIKQYPDIVYKMDCEWNVQLSDNSRSERCYARNYSIIKVIHWNSPRKYKVKLKNIKYFQNVHQMFLGYDGNLLRSKLIICKEDFSSNKLNDTDPCFAFRHGHMTKLRTHLYFMEFAYSHKDSYDVTLVAQLSMDRLQFVEELSSHWEGPMSLAFYISDAESQELLTFVEDWSELLKKRKNIAYHLVYKQGTHYPVNHLRNVALKNVVTPYVFLMDIDFLPMFGIYDYLRKSIQLTNPGPLKKALVVPAFETQRYRSKFPRNKSNVLKQLEAGNLYTFRYHVWKKGHAPTDYLKWRNSSYPYQIEWQPDYEPYIVAHNSIPSYDPRFTGFGWNKVSHVMEMYAQGYTFIVLPSAFIVHMPHAPSLEINQFRNSIQYRMCLKKLKEEFIGDLNKKYHKDFNIDNM
ncbi:xylosyl- and glucuronyltransferase LARGE2s-like [Arctopsyche grandis]|uniref:xylosyl- and glucuronyltransferase LARGE2s-like n=1 Tax=Arctopsyche grandis TaxID=121162 RepID=UPI00406D8F2B